MGIDLEEPSREYNMNASAVDGDNGRQDCNSMAGDEMDAEPAVGRIPLDTLPNAYTPAGLNSIKYLEPHVGMYFESKEDAFSFYKEYAKSVGFSTIIKASRRSRISGKFIDAKFVCTRYGNKQEASMNTSTNPVVDTTVAGIPGKRKRGRISRSWSKTDCKACMHVKRRQQDGRWIVCGFVKEHNHEIFSNQAYSMHDLRNLDRGNTNAALHAIRSGTKKVYVSMSRQSDAYKDRDILKNNVTTRTGSTQPLALEEGDAEVILDYFTYMQDENPNFFYVIDLNEEQRLRNVFWVDAKARLDYSYFGDVVFFDTTFIKNEYKLPLAPFVGVNHHSQHLLLGSALVSDVTKSTYVWLMRAWLRAMGGHAPRVILTDQDKSLEEAIAEVFPNSYHCFCLWHILSKIPEKLSSVLRQQEYFMTKFNKCIFKSGTEEQFEKRWWKLTQRFNLKNDVWFQSIYGDRRKWMPMYIKGKFFAGMSTAQQSESVITFFDKYIQRKTTLKEFIEQQKAITQEKFEEEAKADFETWHKQPGLKSPSPFGKQMAALYTHAIFKKFQVEVLGVVACHPSKESEDGETKTFKVRDFEENQDFAVLCNEITSYFSCSCCLFEFNGFLCRHVLIVMQMSGVHSIPSPYILKRWTKDAKNRESMTEESNKAESRVQCDNDLLRKAFKLGDEGSLSQESYKIAFTALEEALRKCETVNRLKHGSSEPTSLSSNGAHQHEEASQANNLSETNEKDDDSPNRQHSAQVLSEPEVAVIRMHESWRQLGRSSLTEATHDCSLELQESMQRMEHLNSRAGHLGGYLGPQQNLQGMGELNSVACSYDDYYTTQHNMQRLGPLNSMTPLHEARYLTRRIPVIDQSNIRLDQSHDMASKLVHSKQLSK